MKPFYSSFALSMLIGATNAWAQAYPSKPIRLIVPFPAGGPTDIAGRTVAKIINDALGQPVVVENRAGAGGVIGNDVVAKSPADGYTLGIATISTLGVAPSINPKLPYDPIKDVTPITNVVATIGAIIAHPQFPANNVAELIAMAKAKPGSVSYASPGMGTIVHLGTEHLALNAAERGWAVRARPTRDRS